MSTVTRQAEPKLDRNALAAMYEETFRNFEEGTITEGSVVARMNNRGNMRILLVRLFDVRLFGEAQDANS